MTLKEQYENMSDEELIERYTDSEDYLLEAKIVILEELKKRGLKSKEEINQKLEKVEKEKIEKDKMNEERHRKKKEKVDKVIKSKITMTLGIMSIISVISLIITLFAVSIYRTGKFEIEQKKEAQLKEKNKVNKISMWEKYPEAFIKEKNILNEIRNTIRNSDEKSTIKYENVPMDLRCYYDKTGREVYSVEHKVELSHRGGGKGATIRTRYYPEEKGVFYGENGIIKAKIEIRSSGMEYDVNTEKKEERRNFIIDGRHPGLHIFTLYTYDEKGKKTKEEEYRINYAMSDYIQTIRTYVDGKINKETVLQDVLNDGNRGIIIVDIEKNYDKNENLISKKVVRKNKNNSIWSETDFDLLKGEIITKYYERDKAFATVTETLVGKDKSIVKRERVGDDFVIWDFVKLTKSKMILDKFFLQKEKIKFSIKNTEYFVDCEYNDDEKGVNKLSYRYEIFYWNNLSKDKSLSLGNTGELFEYTNNNGYLERQKILFNKNGEKTFFPNEIYIIDQEYRDKYENKKEILEKEKINEISGEFKIENYKWR